MKRVSLADYSGEGNYCMIIDTQIRKSIFKTARFYDQKKVGDCGPLGFRRSTDLTRLADCLDELMERKIVIPGESVFLDMGCGDGRVNVLFGYVVRESIGIELDEWTLDDYSPLRRELEITLKKDGFQIPGNNISLFHGDSMDKDIHELISGTTGVAFKDFDLFYTYLTMQEEFAELISQKARKGAIFMVYGLDRIMPELNGLELLTREKPLNNILALYRKI